MRFYAFLHVLGTQLFPRQQAYFQDAYRKATEKPYGYLMIDMHPSTHASMRLRTNIFPGKLELPGAMPQFQDVFLSKNPY